MKFLEEMIAAAAPQWALARARARLQLDGVERIVRSYDGARRDHRALAWTSRNGSANAAMAPGFRVLRARARDLVRNTPLGKRAVEILTAHVVGTGLTPAFRTNDTAQRERLADGMKEFAETCDARGQTTLGGQQEQAVRAMFESGEALVLEDVDDGRPGFLVIEGDYLDDMRTGTFDNETTRLGVGFERFRPAGYWLYPDHPGEITGPVKGLVSKRVDATGVYHLYRVRRPGQVRGVTELAAIMQVMRDRADYFDAALVKARAEACHVGVVTKPLGDAPTTIAEREETVDGVTRTYGELSPGMILQLQAGEEMDFSTPTGSAGLNDFLMAAALDGAIGTGITYAQATGDLRQANYSSLRAGGIEQRRLVEQIQYLTVIPMLARPMGEAFLRWWTLDRRYRPGDDKVWIDWIPPAFEPTDPLKDLQADILAVRSGRMTAKEFVAAWGNDPATHFNEIAEVNGMLDALDLTLEIDPRRVVRGSARQAATEKAADAAE